MLLNGKGNTLIYYPDSKPEEEYTLPEEIKYIQEGAINDPKFLKTLHLPAGLLKMQHNGISTDADCALEEIYIPAGVEGLEAAAISVPRGDGYKALKIYCEDAEKPDSWDEHWLVNNQVQCSVGNGKYETTEGEYTEPIWNYSAK